MVVDKHGDVYLLGTTPSNNPNSQDLQYGSLTIPESSGQKRGVYVVSMSPKRGWEWVEYSGGGTYNTLPAFDINGDEIHIIGGDIGGANSGYYQDFGSNTCTNTPYRVVFNQSSSQWNACTASSNLWDDWDYRGGSKFFGVGIYNNTFSTYQLEKQTYTSTSTCPGSVNGDFGFCISGPNAPVGANGITLGQDAKPIDLAVDNYGNIFV